MSPEQLKALQESGIRYENLVGLSNEQMLAQYSDCDIVSFPSTFEGFGMPIIEGNLVGRPVIAGNVASMPEVAGDAACLVDPFDVESIRSGFLRVIQDAAYREQLVARGFENAKRFDHTAIAAQYEDVYRKVAAECSRSPRASSRDA
jgi:glycosyltransferase involved in cell wall biosynthesis